MNRMIDVIDTRDPNDELHLMRLTYDERADWWYGDLQHWKTPAAALRSIRRYYTDNTRKFVVLREVESVGGAL